MVFFLMGIAAAEPIGKMEAGDLLSADVHFSPNGRQLGVCFSDRMMI